ncbi:MAG: S1 family peptidase [Chloroflexota bacterium]|nr:S1 family peptidase [Chloroflexota bacterium]
MARRDSLIADQGTLEAARQYKAELLSKMFASTQSASARGSSAGRRISPLSLLPPHSNVVGVGYGSKLSYGASGAIVENEIAVRVYVRTKLPQSEVPVGNRVPAKVNGKPTDVIAVGDLSLLARPICCGVSIGHRSVTAGTLGCLVKRTDGASDDRFILSCNHVLADCNRAAIGDPILEPGLADGGDAYPPIAELTEFEPLSFTEPNGIDAAIARVINPNDVRPDIHDIGYVEPPAGPAAVYQSVRKYGRTTRHTVGVIMDIAADFRARAGTELVDFENQLEINGVNGAFSDSGDSGSLVVDAVKRHAVALLFAGGGGATFASPINPVLFRFGVEIVSRP